MDRKPSARARQQRHIQGDIREQARHSDAQAFFNLLTAPDTLDEVESLLPAHRERLFPPTETLSMFLAQALNADRSCQQAVNNTALHRAAIGLPTCSTHTGAYCRARQRLPTPMVSTLARSTGRRVVAHAAHSWHWRNRPVRLVDGTTVTLPDTPANQAAYPQSRNQRPGLGFPICRMVALMCLGSGALLDAAISPYQGKEGQRRAVVAALDARYAGAWRHAGR